MPDKIQRVSPCLWFDENAEAAARFYVSIFDHSKILQVSYYGEAGYAVHGRQAGSVMTVEFELDGCRFTALNGGPVFRFNEAVSFQVNCESQDEVDQYWERLSAGGEEAAQRCGWLKDQFGVSWQIVPAVLAGLMRDEDPEKPERVMQALLQMKKPDIAALQRAHEGRPR